MSAATVLPSTPRTRLAEPPAWVDQSTIDFDGCGDGPSKRIDSGRIGLHTGWHPIKGSCAWVDALLESGGPLTSTDLRAMLLWAAEALPIVEEQERIDAGVTS